MEVFVAVAVAVLVAVAVDVLVLVAVAVSVGVAVPPLPPHASTCGSSPLASPVSPSAAVAVMPLPACASTSFISAPIMFAAAAHSPRPSAAAAFSALCRRLVYSPLFLMSPPSHAASSAASSGSTMAAVPLKVAVGSVCGPCITRARAAGFSPLSAERRGAGGEVVGAVASQRRRSLIIR